jgi:hypothetical protein
LLMFKQSFETKFVCLCCHPNLILNLGKFSPISLEFLTLSSRQTVLHHSFVNLQHCNLDVWL